MYTLIKRFHSQSFYSTVMNVIFSCLARATLTFDPSGSQVDQNRVKLLNDRAVAKSQLQKKLGQFLYLSNLEKVLSQHTHTCPCFGNTGACSVT